MWDPFLIKKLLKSVICGTVNSTNALFTVDKVNYCGLKKKKKEENVEKKRRRGFQFKANGHYVFS